MDENSFPSQPEPFRRHYRLGRSDQSDGANGGPRGKQGLGHYESPHSLFGIIGQVARDTGWSIDYILNLNYVTLMLIQTDVPRYIEKTGMTPEEIARHFGEMDKKRKQGEATSEKGVDPLTFFTQYAAK